MNVFHPFCCRYFFIEASTTNQNVPNIPIVDGYSEYARDSSDVSPSFHRTNPSGILRHADPDPNRAKIVNSFSVNETPAAAKPARVRAANPDADAAAPAPFGNVFFVTTSAYS